MLNVDLFKNIQNGDVLSLLSCLGLKTKNYKKGEIIISYGQKTNNLFIILSGKARIIKKNLLGEDEKISDLKVNDIFGQDFVCLAQNKSPVSLLATEECEILILNYEKIVTPCSKVCDYHLKLIKNLISMIAKKNSALNTKIDVVGQRFSRNKIIAFLKQESKGKDVFEIEYNREQMAKFLSLDRCALSRELSKMQKEGLLIFKKNRFKINF